MGAYKARKATFTVTGTGKSRVFAAANERAKIVVSKAKGLGKRRRANYPTLTVAELKAMKSKGTYKFFAYGSDNSLKAIRF